MRARKRLVASGARPRAGRALIELVDSSTARMTVNAMDVPRLVKVARKAGGEIRIVDAPAKPKKR